MQRHRFFLPALMAASLGLAACTVERLVDAPPSPVYSQASPYAPQAGHGGAYQPADSYCAEAVGTAQDAAAQAAFTGSERDAGRAARTAGYARRDC